MTGRADAAPNSRIATPGASDNVAPIVASRFFVSSCPSSTVVGWYDSNCGRAVGLTDSTSAKCRSKSIEMLSVAGVAPIVISVRRVL